MTYRWRQLLMTPVLRRWLWIRASLEPLSTAVAAVTGCSSSNSSSSKKRRRRRRRRRRSTIGDTECSSGNDITRLSPNDTDQTLRSGLSSDILTKTTLQCICRKKLWNLLDKPGFQHSNGVVRCRFSYVTATAVFSVALSASDVAAAAAAAAALNDWNRIIGSGLLPVGHADCGGGCRPYHSWARRKACRAQSGRM